MNNGSSGKRETGKSGNRVIGRSGNRVIGEPGTNDLSPPVVTDYPFPRLPGHPPDYPVNRLPGSPVRLKLSRRRAGLSALFDAILFFIIILAATGALFYWAAAMTASTTTDMSNRDLGRYVSDIQTSALGCDVGPVEYGLQDSNFTFNGSIRECLRTMLVCRNADQNSDFGGLIDAVRGVYAVLVEKPFHFSLRAAAKNLGPDLVISEDSLVAQEPGAVRWTSAVPLIINGVEAELTLYIWR